MVDSPGQTVAPSPLLETKLYVPKWRPGLVSRPRLIERLDQGIERKLTLVSAPAGFGKTTLLAEWVAASSASERPAAWVSLDQSDNDPARFWAYFITALQTVRSGVGESALSLLYSPQPPPTEALQTTLINEITTIPHDFVLVLDDYHVIDAQPVHSGITFLLDHLPSQMNLVIATRADPPLPLARLRGRSELTELRAADLRFAADEMTAFLNKVMDLNLSLEDVATLEARTEGWIAGLQLAALSLQSEQDVSGFIAAFSGSDRYVIDYLAEEVLNRQSHCTRTFLLETSVLDRLAGPLCDAVTGRGDGQATLEMLEDSNLFLVPLDNERRWYRYHHLFGNSLRNRLHRGQPDQVPELHDRASRWYEDNGLIAEAIGHALQAKDFERAADLVEQTAQALVARGEATTLLAWLEALPGELIRSRPQLCLAHSWVLFLLVKLDEAELLLRDVEAGCAVASSRHDRAELEAILGEVAAVRALIALVQEDMPRAIELSHQALEHLPGDNLYLRGLITMNLGLVYHWNGDIAAARRAYSEAVTISQKTGHALTAMFSLTGLAQLQMLQGHLGRSVGLYEQARQFLVDLMGQAGLRLPVASLYHRGLGEVLRERNDLEAATRHLLEGIELGKQLGLPGILTDGYVALARVRQSQGDADGAQEMLRHADELARASKAARVVAPVAACRVWLWLSSAGRNLAAAARWAQEYGIDDKLIYFHEVEHIAVARVLIAQGKPEEAVGWLARLREAAEAGGRTGRVIEILSLQALAYQARGDRTQTMAALERALLLAEPEGYVRTFVDEGAPMAALLRRAASRGVAPAYVSKLLDALDAEAPMRRGPTGPASPLAQPLEDHLSERELEVLRLIAAGLSNRDIAQELVLTTGTVKKHINNIFTKLNVRSRTQAVSQASEINLL